jgi:hypothetical protein
MGWSGATGSKIAVKITFWIGVVAAVAAVARIAVWGVVLVKWFSFATTSEQGTMDLATQIGALTEKLLIDSWPVLLVVSIVLIVVGALQLRDRRHTGEAQLWFAHRSLVLPVAVAGLLVFELLMRGLALGLWAIWVR